MIQWIISSTVLILVVLAVRQAVKGRISPRLRYALWALVLVRLLVPFDVGAAAFSVMRAAEEIPVVREAQALEDVAYIEFDPQSGTVMGNTHYEFMPDFPTVQVAEQADMNDYARMKAILTAQRYALPLWRSGVVVMLLAFALSNSRFREQLKRTRRRLELPQFPLPVYAVRVETPCLFGLLRPAVYIPEEVAAEETMLRHALAHELTHYRQGDELWAYLRCLALALHWYNPLVWLAAHLSRQDGELSCDAGTLNRLSETERTAYGRTLLALTCGEAGKQALFCTATTMSGSKAALRERITCIARRPKTYGAVAAAAALALAVVGAAVFTGAPEEAPQPPQTPPPAASLPAASIPAEVIPEERMGTFTNLMGLDGYWVETELVPHHYQRQYFAATEQGDICIGETFGFEIDDYIRDVDGDGVTELIGNVTFGGDGAQRVYVFHRYGSAVYRMTLDWDDLDIPWEGQMAHAISERYNENTTTVPKGDTMTLETTELRQGFLNIGYQDMTGGAYRVVPREMDLAYFDVFLFADLSAGNPGEDIQIVINPTEKTTEINCYPRLIPEAQGIFREAWDRAMAAFVDEPHPFTRQMGTWVVCDEEWFQLMADGTLAAPGSGFIPAEAAAELWNLVLNEAATAGVSEVVRPEDIVNLASATLRWEEEDITVTDPETLDQIEACLSTSEEIWGGTGCWYTGLLTLTTEDGERLLISMATDSCAAWMSQGVCYDYSVKDNRGFFDLFGVSTEELF